MILLMMEEIKAVAVLAPGVPSVSKLCQFSHHLIVLVLIPLFFFKIPVPHGTREGQVLPT